MTEILHIVERLGAAADPTRVLATFFASVPVAAALFKVDGRVIVVNGAFVTLFGAEPVPGYDLLADPVAAEQGLPQGFRRALAGDDIAVPASWSSVRGADRIEVTPARRVAIEVTIVPLFDRAHAVCAVACFYKDVTVAHLLEASSAAIRRAEEDRAATQEALRQREAMFHGLLEAAPDAMVIVDTKGVIQVVNGQTERVFGYARAELLGMPIERLLPERFRDRHVGLVRAFGEAPRSREMGTGLEVHGRRRDGTEFPAEVALISMSNADGTLISAAIRDVTEARQAEAIRIKNLELEVENARVREASRLKSEFLANMSHELRTPLNAIIGFGEILFDGQVDPSSPLAKEFLGDILISGRHLLQLINDVLDVSKVEAGQMVFRPESVDVFTVIHEVCSIVRAQAAAQHINVVVEVESGLDATLDPARFKQVLYNYLSNALKVTRGGGRVVIRALSEGANQLRLEVEDAGPGIAAPDLARLFREFVQLESQPAQRASGTGLGLALTKKLVEAQGGSVGVTSTVGRGSVFFAVLPRRPPSQWVPEETTVFRTGASVGQSVLVVEADPGERALHVDTLSAAGYVVDTATTGEAAIAKARVTAFDAITLALLLPDISGLDVLAAIRTGGQSQETVIVLVSVVADAHAACGFVVHDVLSKPFSPESLVESLRRGIAGAVDGAVLVVEDDPATLKLLEHTVEQLGLVATCCSDATAALEIAARTRPVAVILDLLMPGMDGFEFLDRFRALPAHGTTPVIIWTGKDLNAQEHTRLDAAARARVLQKSDGVAAVVAALEASLPGRGAKSRTD